MGFFRTLGASHDECLLMIFVIFNVELENDNITFIYFCLVVVDVIKY